MQRSTMAEIQGGTPSRERLADEHRLADVAADDLLGVGALERRRAR